MTLREAMRPSGPAAARLARVSGGQGVVVTTGQQPGLFGGPMYTIVKALSAAEVDPSAMPEPTDAIVVGADPYRACTVLVNARNLIAAQRIWIRRQMFDVSETCAN